MFAIDIELDYHGRVFIDAETVSMKTEIVFQIVLDNHFHMFGEDLEAMNLFHRCIVNNAIARQELLP